MTTSLIPGLLETAPAKEGSQPQPGNSATEDAGGNKDFQGLMAQALGQPGNPAVPTREPAAAPVEEPAVLSSTMSLPHFVLGVPPKKGFPKEPNPVAKPKGATAAPDADPQNVAVSTTPPNGDQLMSLLAQMVTPGLPLVLPAASQMGRAAGESMREAQGVVPGATAVTVPGANTLATATVPGEVPPPPAVTTNEAISPPVPPATPQAPPLHQASRMTAAAKPIKSPKEEAILKTISEADAKPKGAMAWEPPKIKTQVADLEKQGNLQVVEGKSASGSGTAGALNKEQMKFNAKQDEIAGNTEQKLPGAVEVDRNGGGVMGNADGKAGQGFQDHSQQASPGVSAMEASLPLSGAAATQAYTGSGGLNTKAETAIQANRVEEMVGREVVTLKQSGASSLAVSLKVDSRTEIFLQLTNHDGQIQAQLRCERGNIAGLNSHWGQLQESLARQNVQLLPLTESRFTANSNPQQNFNNSEPRQSGQPGQNPGRQTQEAPETAGEETTKSSRPRGGKNKTPGQQGWESWA